MSDQPLVLTAHLGGCDGGPCPKIKRTSRPGTIYVQGAKLSAADLAAAGEMPAHETGLLIPEEVLREAARALLS